MNQQQQNYMDAHHSMSTGQQYAPHASTAAVGNASAQQFVGSPAGAPSTGYQHQQQHDPTGQVAPAGMKPRVTATLWEDEGCMCFQVETKGVCVARRDDNHMINGTKLLNVAGMTRGRRDGILKSEKTRHVVKIGPMHLKGVWIPFDRALDFANKEKITEQLYPLFVHNIGALLYHPTNQNRTSAVMAATQQQDRRRSDKMQGGIPSTTQPPSLTHHHSMNSSSGNPQPTSIAPNPSSGGRPTIERAHTFPTPPTSASGTMTSMGSQQGSYDWTNSSISGSGQSIAIENHPQSTPATPATTPPGSTLPSLQPYQSQQHMYGGHAGSHGQFPSQQQSLARTGSLQSNMYTKQEMGPPSTRVSGSRPESEPGDMKLDHYGQGQANDTTQDAEAEHEQDSDYPQSNAPAYTSHRNSFDTSYHTAANLASYNDNAQIASDVNGTSTINGGSGRATPRTSQSQWTAGYHTPPRAAPSSSLYNPTSDARGTLANGNTNADGFVPGPYAPTQMNGVKRIREDDDMDSTKRRKTTDGLTNNSMINGSFEGETRAINRARPATKTARAR
ncbi:uncharacterized protein KY384_002447 [Bacidia gigantensis]|uniref:uncharacterized protein n=1 Tax=Bacidia gigantensis TaxID=2732470 RepID=UPI001D054935|nr:uncharacterized protein KY384_002447 [Bacidia gigantensis]KAG8532570.1 hypothetical protein KY384_002447 [Bacidia gigantensis]